MISIDTKINELIVNFAREGHTHTHTQAQVQTLDHDFSSAAHGKLIPQGLYDLTRNERCTHLNTRLETSEFCCDFIERWWERDGSKRYPHARGLVAAV